MQQTKQNQNKNKHVASYIVSCADPTNPRADCFQYRMQGEGPGDFCHVLCSL